jgi:hypothetical protein
LTEEEEKIKIKTLNKVKGIIEDLIKENRIEIIINVNI